MAILKYKEKDVHFTQATFAPAFPIEISYFSSQGNYSKYKDSISVSDYLNYIKTKNIEDNQLPYIKALEDYNKLFYINFELTHKSIFHFHFPISSCEEPENFDIVTDKDKFKDYCDMILGLSQWEQEYLIKTKNTVVPSIIIDYKSYKKSNVYINYPDKKIKHIQYDASNFNHDGVNLYSPEEICKSLAQYKFFTKRLEKSLLKDLDNFSYIEQNLINLPKPGILNKLYFLVEYIPSTKQKYNFIRFEGFKNSLNTRFDDISYASFFANKDVAQEYLHENMAIISFDIKTDSYSLIEVSEHSEVDFNDLKFFLEKKMIEDKIQNFNETSYHSNLKNKPKFKI